MNQVIHTVEQIQLQSLIASGVITGNTQRMDFAQSIAYRKNASPKQLEWVQKLLDEAFAPKTPVSGVLYTNAFSLFNKAKKHLKYPKVSLIFMRTGELKISVASSSAKYPGALSLVVAGLPGSGYVGRIHTDGTLILTNNGRNFKNEIEHLLGEFDRNPEGVASAHGKLLSRCCFCSLPLKTQESLAVGYGPDCAKHWGLYWGVKAQVKDQQIIDDNVPMLPAGVINRGAVLDQA